MLSGSRARYVYSLVFSGPVSIQTKCRFLDTRAWSNEATILLNLVIKVASNRASRSHRRQICQYIPAQSLKTGKSAANCM